MPTTENFDHTWLPPVVDPRDAFAHELRVLSGLLGPAMTTRHFMYEGLTGKEESWEASNYHAVLGLITPVIGYKLANRFLK